MDEIRVGHRILIRDRSLSYGPDRPVQDNHVRFAPDQTQRKLVEPAMPEDKDKDLPSDIADLSSTFLSIVGMDNLRIFRNTAGMESMIFFYTTASRAKH